MRDGKEAGGGRFDDIDSNLTVFALANGLDLSRNAGSRVLEWFSEGLERSIVIEVTATGFRVRAATWPSEAPAVRSEVTLHDDLSPEELRSALSGAIDAANALEAPGTDPDGN